MDVAFTLLGEQPFAALSALVVGVEPVGSLALEFALDLRVLGFGVWRDVHGARAMHSVHASDKSVEGACSLGREAVSVMGAP